MLCLFLLYCCCFYTKMKKKHSFSKCNEVTPNVGNLIMNTESEVCL